MFERALSQDPPTGPFLAAKDNVSMAFLTRAFDELADEVFVYSADTLRLVYMNGSALARTGWAPETVTSRAISDTTATFDVELLRRHTAPLLAGDTSSVRIEVMHPNGPVEVSTQLIDGPEGEALFLSVLRDLSWRKEVEREKLEAISTVSHELRTPLTSIHGAMQLLQAGVAGTLGGEARSVIDIASRNVDRLVTLVDDLLDFEKIRTNTMDFTIERTDLLRSIRDVEEALSPDLNSHDVSIVVTSAFERALVAGNSARLAQVLTNFLSNAIKYSPPGGTVRVDLSDQGGAIEVAITDQGPGIAENQQRQLFKPFSRVASADGKHRPGTGLGLAIVSAILHRLEFPFGVRSKPGHGATFHFTVPKHHVVDRQGDDVTSGADISVLPTAAAPQEERTP